MQIIQRLLSMDLTAGRQTWWLQHQLPARPTLFLDRLWDGDLVRRPRRALRR
ncbi:MAG: hypothetical protein K8J09_02530 [Planctomycetes bacterium]|nr:hypothetical protein [Planctomycetota bacterium]MCC7396797.1 hypothetical protein [Planctomycetota bacterium]